MTKERFNQLWDETGSNFGSIKNPKIVMEGCSQHTTDALIAYGRGDKSHFTELENFFK